MQPIKLVVLLLMVAIGAASCASGRAQAIEDRPTLAVPDVPPRTIEPQPVAELPPVDPLPEPNTVAAPPPPRRPTNNRPSEPRPAESKPDTPAEASTGTATPPPAPVAPLRTSSSPTGSEASRQIRDILQRVESSLSRVDYQKLSDDRRATYDMAKSFKQQSEEKLKQEDLNLALSFAQRAENMVKTLVGEGR